MAEHLLLVTAHDQVVGEVGFESHQDVYSFKYDAAWQQRDDAFPLSPHIPLSGEAPAAGAVQRFLQNLLPEGRALDVASIVNQISKDNIFSPVSILGKEPVGGLSFLPIVGLHSFAEQNPPPIRRLISDGELSQRIRAREQIPFPVWTRRFACRWRATRTSCRCSSRARTPL